MKKWLLPWVALACVHRAPPGPRELDLSDGEAARCNDIPNMCFDVCYDANGERETNRRLPACQKGCEERVRSTGNPWFSEENGMCELYVRLTREADGSAAADRLKGELEQKAAAAKESLKKTCDDGNVYACVSELRDAREKATPLTEDRGVQLLEKACSAWDRFGCLLLAVHEAQLGDLDGATRHAALAQKLGEVQNAGDDARWGAQALKYCTDARREVPERQKYCLNFQDKVRSLSWGLFRAFDPAAMVSTQGVAGALDMAAVPKGAGWWCVHNETETFHAGDMSELTTVQGCFRSKAECKGNGCEAAVSTAECFTGVPSGGTASQARCFWTKDFCDKQRERFRGKASATCAAVP